jgi:hypothetical protein
VLHVDRGVDVDAGLAQLFDVLPALGVARASDIGVRKFVDDDQLRLARESRVQIEFAQGQRTVGQVLRGKDFESFEQGFGFRASMQLDVSDHHIHP